MILLADLIWARGARKTMGGSDEGGAEPLDAVVGLGGEVAVLEGEDVGALAAAVAGFARNDSWLVC